MLNNFKEDLEQGKEAERLVKEVFSGLTAQYTFEAIGDQREYYYKGDIRATGADGREFYIEVKNDSRIAASENILCEDENYIKDSGRMIKGNMHCDSDYFCIVSQEARKIYVLDFKRLQEIYKKGEHRVISHAQ